MKLVQAQDIMTSPVETISSEASLAAAAALMISGSLRCLPVIGGDGSLVGVITSNDFSVHPSPLPMGAQHLYSILGQWTSKEGVEEEYRKAASREVKDIMSKPVVTVMENATMAEIADKMLRYRVHHLPVLRGWQVVGLISAHDFMKLVVE